MAFEGNSWQAQNLHSNKLSRFSVFISFHLILLLLLPPFSVVPCLICSHWFFLTHSFSSTFQNQSNTTWHSTTVLSKAQKLQPIRKWGAQHRPNQSTPRRDEPAGHQYDKQSNGMASNHPPASPRQKSVGGQQECALEWEIGKKWIYYFCWLEWNFFDFTLPSSCFLARVFNRSQTGNLTS